MQVLSSLDGDNFSAAYYRRAGTGKVGWAGIGMEKHEMSEQKS